jgi:hypothetical protein
MILPFAFIIGMIFGVYKASLKNGNRLDKLQYGIAHGLALSLLTLFIVIVCQRMGIF